MAQKHLHELLEHVQDPFLLNNYIADRRSKLNPKKRSAAAAVLGDLHIPSPTAALLLEAALRIFHDQPPEISPTPKFQILGLFGTLFTNSFICRNREHNTTTSTVPSSSSMSDHHHQVQTDEEGKTEDQASPKRRVPFCLSICKGATFNRLSTPATPIRRRQELFNGVQIHLEEEKEPGSSPVSVLEPDPFKEDEDDEDKKATAQSLYCWNGGVTDSKKQKLLDKLKRFERLDPRELDKTLVLSSLEQQEEDGDRCDEEFEVLDVIVDFEMGREVDDGWNDSEQVAIEIEVSIYGDLVHELLNDFLVF